MNVLFFSPKSKRKRSGNFFSQKKTQASLAEGGEGIADKLPSLLPVVQLDGPSEKNIPAPSAFFQKKFFRRFL